MHEELFSHNVLTLGRIHWYLLKADSEMEARRRRKAGDDPSKPTKTELTEFGKQVGRDEIHWWVFKKEAELEELRARTEHTLEAAQRLKEASSKLLTSPPRTYDDLIATLRRFADTYSSEIGRLHDYVAWLHSKDVLAPSVLFSFRVWGATRLSDRSTRIEANAIEREDPRRIERLAEIVFGLLRRGEYTLDSVRREVEYEMYEAQADIDPEIVSTAGPIQVSQSRVLFQTSHESLREFAVYWEFIRNSLSNILVDIDKYAEQRDLMKSDLFWQGFIRKAIHSGKAEPQLWDLKKTLHMWHIGGGEEKEKAELRFAEEVASFANARGGILVIGVCDSPRKVEGIGENPTDIERRLNYTSRVVAEYLDCDSNAVYFRQVPVEDENGDGQICLVVVIAQTDSATAAKDKQGRYTYPVRRETGFDRVDARALIFQKMHIKSTNFDFIRDLAQFVYDK
jgi:hypothetical protein